MCNNALKFCKRYWTIGCHDGYVSPWKYNNPDSVQRKRCVLFYLVSTTKLFCLLLPILVAKVDSGYAIGFHFYIVWVNVINGRKPFKSFNL